MGLFSSKKVVTVSSSVYNLAGDEDKRPNFLRLATLSTVLSNSDLADNLTQSYLGGPGIRLKNFIQWCDRSGYNDAMGVVTDSLHSSTEVNTSVVIQQMQIITGSDVNIQSTDIGLADIEWWIEQWILQNNNKDFNTNWEADLNEETNVVTITWEDGSISQFTVTNFDTTKRYLYVAYNTTSGREDGPIVQGTTEAVNTFPALDGWVKVTDTSTVGTETLTKTTKVDVTYSDSTPATSTTTTETRDGSYTDRNAEYSQNTYLGGTVTTEGTVIKETNTFRNLNQSHVVHTLDPVVTTTTETTNGVTKTTTTTVTDQEIVVSRVMRDDTQLNTLSKLSPLAVYIYQKGTGNSALDAMFSTEAGKGKYYPYIPMRLWNNFVDEDHYSELYPLSKKALKKATKGDYDKIKTKVADNKSINDINFTYAVFGVSLNVKENACKRYLWEFLSALYTDNIESLDAYNEWKKYYDSYVADYSNFLAWLKAQMNNTDPAYGTKAPEYNAPPSVPQKSVHITSSNNKNINYNVTLSWQAMAISQGTGLAKEGAKKGELWFVQNASDEFSVILHNTSTMNQSFEVDNITLYYQVDLNNWKSITIWGFTYSNLIYGGKSVTIKASEALKDTSESGFIIPLHSDIYANMPLTVSTQMSTACVFLVFNCYKVKKIPWYAKGFFKIFIMIVLIVVVVVISAVTFGVGSVAGVGVLGSAASVGAAIGAVGTTAVIVGAIANALAAVVISITLTAVSKAIFGSALGTLIGSLLSIVVTFGLTAYQSAMSVTDALATVISPKNLPMIMNSASNITAYIAENTVESYAAKTESMLNDYKSKSEDIKEKTWEILGSSPYLDPLLLIDATQQASTEAPSGFFQRTLMLGSDYAEMTKAYVNDMVDMTITTNLEGIV